MRFIHGYINTQFLMARILLLNYSSTIHDKQIKLALMLNQYNQSTLNTTIVSLAVIFHPILYTRYFQFFSSFHIFHMHISSSRRWNCPAALFVSFTIQKFISMHITLSYQFEISEFQTEISSQKNKQTNKNPSSKLNIIESDIIQLKAKLYFNMPVSNNVQSHIFEKWSPSEDSHLTFNFWQFQTANLRKLNYWIVYEKAITIRLNRY